MKVFRGILVTVLILVIVGGVGYIGWSFLGMPGMSHSSTGAATSTNTGQDQMPGMQNNTGHTTTNQNTSQNTNVNTVTMNVLAVQNRNKLNAAISTIDEAMSIITLDPYSTATEATTPPITATHPQSKPQQPATGTGSISIIPTNPDSNIIIINPNETSGAQSTATPSPAPTDNMATGNTMTPRNYVYDQAKLEQLHNGIFTLAQGIAAVKSLNDDLLVQETLAEANPATYQTYVTRYNLALQNKTKLENAMNKITQGYALINVNPYVTGDGYAYNNEAMQRLHKGVYKMAEGIAQLSQLQDAFTQQMVNASIQGQNLVSASNQTMPGMTMTNNTGIFGSISTSTVLQILLVVFVVGLIGGIIGAIFNMFKSRPHIKEEHAEHHA